MSILAKVMADLELFKDLEIFECPLCGGAGGIEVENDWCVYVSCADCGGHTSEVPFNSPDEKYTAAKKAVENWNLGKVISLGTGAN